VAENDLGDTILGCAMKVHSALGPGLLESTYEICLVHEFSKAGLTFARQVALPVIYDGVELDAGYRIDILVADLVIIELKVVEKLMPIHTAQLLSYLKLSRHKTWVSVELQRCSHAKRHQTRRQQLLAWFPPRPLRPLR
jgi:GxxExxY protein